MATDSPNVTLITPYQHFKRASIVCSGTIHLYISLQVEGCVSKRVVELLGDCHDLHGR